MKRKMKDSDIEWIGAVPEHWALVSCSQVADQTKQPNVGMAEKNLLSLSYGKVKRRDINATEGLLPESFEGYNIVEEGDIVLRFTDLQNDHKSLRVGRVSERGIITSAYCTIRPFDPSVSRFLYYALHSFDIRKGFYGMGSGVRQSLNWQEAKYIRIPMPPADERDAIASYLEKECEQIDSAIAAAEASIEEYKQYQKALIFETVTKGLDKTTLMKSSGIKWIDKIPAHWEVAKFKAAYRRASESGHQSEELLSVYLDRGVIKYSESDGRQVHKPSDSLDKYQLVKPGYLVANNQQAWRGSVGVSCYQGIVSPAYHVFEAVSSEVDSRYMNHFFRSAFVPAFGVSSTGVGSIQRNLSDQKLSGELILLPPLAEQRAIAEYLEDSLAKIEQAIEAKRAIIDDLKSYKKSLVFEVVTGKKEVA